MTCSPYANNPPSLQKYLCVRPAKPFRKYPQHRTVVSHAQDQRHHVLSACILGKQYNITVEIGGTTAYTNGKTIHIPSLKIDTDEMYINMTRGYVDHGATCC